MVRRRRRGRFPGRLELPREDTDRGFERFKRVMIGGQATRSALDAVEARERADLAAREPGRPRFALRLSVTAVVIVVLFSVLVVRLWSIQVIQVNTYRKNAIATTTRPVPTPAPRGRILARGGQVLAGDQGEWVVTLKTSIDTSTNPPTRVAPLKTEENLVALLPQLTLSGIKSQLNNEQYGPYTPVPVAEGISPGAASTIQENPSDFPGASVVQEFVRDYPEGDMAAQMLGYLGPITCSAEPGSAACSRELQRYAEEGYQPTDEIGVAGLEAQYEQVLRGTDGVDEVEVDSAGNTIGTSSTTPPKAGDDVVLNLSLPLEQALDSALAAQMSCLRAGCHGNAPVPADWGAAVVMTDTGQVLAIDSAPSYNDNEWVGGISEKDYKALEDAPGYPLNDYALDGDQPPGSTFKIATATAALDDGLITPSTQIDDSGTFELSPGKYLHDAPGDIPMGEINVSTALSVSSDVFFYTLGADFWDARDRFGETPIQNVAAEYGFGQPTGIDLPGADTAYAHGWVDSPQIRVALHDMAPSLYPLSQESWYLGDNVEMAFGQGSTVVTPLEEAEAYATFANGGTRYAPEMAAAIVSPSGELIRRIQPKPLAHVHYAPGVYETLLSGFEGAVQQPIGTAYAAFAGFDLSKWSVAGKTGTATTNNPQPTSWFVAFGGPRNSKTRYVVAVEIDQAGYGAAASAPVVRQVFDWLYAHNGVPPVSLPSGG